MSQTKKEDHSTTSSPQPSPNWIVPKKVLELQVGDRELYEDRSLGTVTFRTEGTRTHSSYFPEQLVITLDGQKFGICIYQQSLFSIKYHRGT